MGCVHTVKNIHEDLHPQEKAEQCTHDVENMCQALHSQEEGKAMTKQLKT